MKLLPVWHSRTFMALSSTGLCDFKIVPLDWVGILRLLMKNQRLINIELMFNPASSAMRIKDQGNDLADFHAK